MSEPPCPPPETQYPLDEHMTELYPVVQRLAAAQLRQYAGMTLEPGDLVSQLHIKLQQSEPDRRVGRTHFVSLALAASARSHRRSAVCQSSAVGVLSAITAPGFPRPANPAAKSPSAPAPPASLEYPTPPKPPAR